MRVRPPAHESPEKCSSRATYLQCGRPSREAARVRHYRGPRYRATDTRAASNGLRDRDSHRDYRSRATDTICRVQPEKSDAAYRLSALSTPINLGPRQFRLSTTSTLIRVSLPSHQPRLSSASAGRTVSRWKHALLARHCRAPPSTEPPRFLPWAARRC